MTQPITSITRGPRQSNFELLRIIAMFMVLTVHADFSTFGAPTPSEIANSPWSSFGRIFVESAAIMGVNIFIMISGWFGIKPTIKGFCNLVFQVCYFFILSLIITQLCGIRNFTIIDLADLLCLRSSGWFIVSYIILYAISPVLNTFIETANKQTQLRVVICFFVLQTLYGFIGLSPNFNAGYSTFSFIGLYLLSAYARRNWSTANGKLGGGNSLYNSGLHHIHHSYNSTEVRRPNVSLLKSVGCNRSFSINSTIQSIKDRINQNCKLYCSLGIRHIFASCKQVHVHNMLHSADKVCRHKLWCNRNFGDDDCGIYYCHYY